MCETIAVQGHGAEPELLAGTEGFHCGMCCKAFKPGEKMRAKNGLYVHEEGCGANRRRMTFFLHVYGGLDNVQPMIRALGTRCVSVACAACQRTLPIAAEVHTDDRGRITHSPEDCTLGMGEARVMSTSAMPRFAIA